MRKFVIAFVFAFLACSLSMRIEQVFRIQQETSQTPTEGVPDGGLPLDQLEEFLGLNDPDDLVSNSDTDQMLANLGSIIRDEHNFVMNDWPDVFNEDGSPNDYFLNLERSLEQVGLGADNIAYILDYAAMRQRSPIFPMEIIGHIIPDEVYATLDDPIEADYELPIDTIDDEEDTSRPRSERVREYFDQLGYHLGQFPHINCRRYTDGTPLPMPTIDPEFPDLNIDDIMGQLGISADILGYWIDNAVINAAHPEFEQFYDVNHAPCQLWSHTSA